MRLNFTVQGRSGAPWLVFSNSLATDLTLWDAQVDAFAADWRILRYDYRGHGGSPPSAATHLDPQVLAGDLLAVMDAVGADRACHVGVSMGALAGLAAAALMPQRFRAMVCCNARLTSARASAVDLALRAERVRREGMQALVAPTIDKWFGKAAMPLPASARERIARMIAETRAADFAAYAMGMRDYDLEAAAAGLDIPVLLLAGSDDGDLPQAFRELAKREPQIEYAEIAGAGHLPNIQAPGAFNARLATFLKGLPVKPREAPPAD